MANLAADPKAAPLADDQKEYLLSLDPKVFPKNFFCALCNQLALDSYKLLCCNKAICSSCQAKIEFPATCPSCEHSPLEADSCAVNKALRATMRVWITRQKKKDEKAAAQAATPTTEVTPAPVEAQSVSVSGDTEKPAESIEQADQTENALVGEVSVDRTEGSELKRTGSEASQPQEGSTSLAEGPTHEDGDGDADQGTTDGQQQPDSAGYENGNSMNTNGMQGQFGYNFNPNQGNMAGMSFNNGMNQMNGMSNMMGNVPFNMNPMGFGMNNMNGMTGMPGMPNNMYGGYGGNAGMGMNDMSAMGYGGGYGNGWNGMGGAGYGFNANGYNQMGGYNQSGAYPEMMNRFPKNNYQNNRFQAHGGNFPQQRNNRNGSFGGNGQGSATQNPNSRPGSRGRLPQTRDGQSPGGTADAAAETKVDAEHAKASVEDPSEGKDETTVTADSATDAAQADASQQADVLTENAESTENVAPASTGLNQIQTIETVEADTQDYDHSMMDDSMQYNPQMMNQFAPQQSHMNGPWDSGMGYPQGNFGHRGGFNNPYGAATVLTGEPRGVGVAGAPTGPRAMREGRPNTGFSSRANNARFNAVPPRVTPSQEAPPTSPVRNVRSRSPDRDENLRTNDRSRSRSRGAEKASDAYRERSRSGVRDEQRDDRERSRTPGVDDYDDRRQERRHHRSSRYDEDDREDRGDYDDRHRDDRDSRGNRTRSASVDSKYHGRRTKDKHRSSRSHRDRSREHRRRHRSRSNSPIEEDKYEDEDSGSRRKGRSEKDRHRERERSRDRDRDRDRRDRKDRDYDDEKYRSRDKDKEKRRRRERDEEEDREYDDEKYRSSRRSRKDRERDRERDRDRDYEREPLSATSTRAISPPLNAPTGPSADHFSIRGASKPKASKNMPPPQPPTGPRGFQPPKGPSADRDRHSRKGSVTSVTSTPSAPAPQDHYAAEREKNARERDRLDRGGKITSSSRSSASHHSSSRPTLSSKRSRDDFEPARNDERAAPTAPASHRDKRRKSGTSGGPDLASMLAYGLRKSADSGGSRKRGGVKTEGDVERELERGERERDGKRW